MYSLFERITLFDTNEDAIKPLYVATKEFLDFFDLDKWEERLAASGKSFLSTPFRTSTRHGQFRWKNYTILRFRPGVYLELIRDAHEEVLSFVRAHGNTQRQADAPEQELSETVLWKNLAGSTLLRLFWKDLDLLGRSTRELFPTLEESWYEKARQAALDGETFVDRMYYAPTGRSYIMTVSQVIHAGYCCITYQEIEDLS